jgi:hypothetical protein
MASKSKNISKISRKMFKRGYRKTNQKKRFGHVIEPAEQLSKTTNLLR